MAFLRCAPAYAPSHPVPVAPFVGLRSSVESGRGRRLGIIFGDTVSTSARSDAALAPMLLKVGSSLRSAADFLAALQYHDFDVTFIMKSWNGSLRSPLWPWMAAWSIVIFCSIGRVLAELNV